MVLLLAGCVGLCRVFFYFKKKERSFYGFCSGFKGTKQQQAHTAPQKDTKTQQHSTTRQHSTTGHNKEGQGATASRPTTGKHTRTHTAESAAARKHTTDTGNDANRQQSTTAHHHTTAHHQRTQDRGAEHQDNPHQTTGRRATRPYRDSTTASRHQEPPGDNRGQPGPTANTQTQQATTHNNTQRQRGERAPHREQRHRHTNTAPPKRRHEKEGAQKHGTRNNRPRIKGSTGGRPSTAPKDRQSTTTCHSSGRGRTRQKHHNETNVTAQNQETYHGTAEHLTAQRSRSRHKNATQPGHAEQQDAPRPSTTHTKTARRTTEREGKTQKKPAENTAARDSRTQQKQHIKTQHNTAPEGKA